MKEIGFSVGCSVIASIIMAIVLHFVGTLGTIWWWMSVCGFGLLAFILTWMFQRSKSTAPSHTDHEIEFASNLDASGSVKVKDNQVTVEPKKSASIASKIRSRKGDIEITDTTVNSGSKDKHEA